jgi:hypothetical protein
MRQAVSLFIVALLTSGCTAFRSQFDDLLLVYASGQNESPVTPTGFVVTPDEMISLVPQSKIGFRLYADRDAYYLREEKDVMGLSTATKTNSQYAKKYGLRVNGRSREEFEHLRRYVARYPEASLEVLQRRLVERRED